MSDTEPTEVTTGTGGTAAIQLEAPTAAPSAALELTPPAPVANVAPEQAEAAVKIDPAQLPKLDAMVTSFVDAATELDIHSDEFTGKVKAVQQLGDRDIRETAEVSNQLLQKPMQEMKKGGSPAGEVVSKGLSDLRTQLEDLDPSRKASVLDSILDHLPFVDEVKNYFRRYEKAQTQLDHVLKSLYGGKDELLKDNAAIEQERANMWEAMQRLQQYIYVAAKLDEALSMKIETIRSVDPDRAKVLEQDMLFYVRQKRQDLMTQLAVSVQGYLALDLIKKNNIELIKGVDRATTTTVAALRTAVIVAQALADQKLVLDQIDALNTTTSSLIASTSEMLRTQTERTYQQAASSGVDMKTLEQAFQNVFATMDSIDNFKSDALQSMQETVTGLQQQIDGAQEYLNRSHGGGAGGDGGKAPAVPAGPSADLTIQ